jgi:hypothetical protein
METNSTHLADLFQQAKGNAAAVALPELATIEQVAELLSLDEWGTQRAAVHANILSKLKESPEIKGLPRHKIGQRPTFNPVAFGFAELKRSVVLVDVEGLCIEGLKPFRARLIGLGAMPQAVNFLLGAETSPTAANFDGAAASLPTAPKVSLPPANFSPLALEICRALGFSGTADEKCKKAVLLSKILGNLTTSGFSRSDVERVFANLDRQPKLKAGYGFYFVLPTIAYLVESLPYRPPGKHLRQVSNG